MSKPCRHWTILPTHAGHIIAAAATEDLCHLPPSALGVLHNAANAKAIEIMYGVLAMTEDDDAPSDYPMTTLTFDVCLLPVRVLFAPGDLWQAYGTGVH